MPRPKKTDKKPVEKPKATAKRRKDKEGDHDDLEEFEEKPEKKLKVGGQNKGKPKIYILAYLDKRYPDSTSAEVHSFKDLGSALEFRRHLIEKFEGKRDEDDVGGSGIPYFDRSSKEYIYDGFCSDGYFCIRIKELTFDEFLKGKDLNIQLYGK